MQYREVKLVMLGGGGVGKSSIFIREVRGLFVEEYDPYMDDIFRKVIDLNGEFVTLEILETTGQEEFVALRDMYYIQGEGFIIVYSITSHNSFEEVGSIKKEIYRVKDIDDDDYVPIIIAGNKIDLEEERQVTTEEGEQLADEWGVDFIECSAKENININELFQNVAMLILEDRQHKNNFNSKMKKQNKAPKCILS
ncbi:small monomeric GTPase [Entamoeba marina]